MMYVINIKFKIFFLSTSNSIISKKLALEVMINNMNKVLSKYGISATPDYLKNMLKGPNWKNSYFQNLMVLIPMNVNGLWMNSL